MDWPNDIFEIISDRANPSKNCEEEKTQIIKNWRQITVQKLLNIFIDRYTDRIT